MNAIGINIGWVCFLGLLGGFIAIAYYIHGRVAALEANGLWLKETLTELLIASENERAKLLEHGPDACLTTKGYDALARSGLRSYVDVNKRQLLSRFDDTARSSLYQLQRQAFRLLADLRFENVVADHLDRFAFSSGISTDLLRRAAAIYLRDIVAQSN